MGCKFSITHLILHQIATFNGRILFNLTYTELLFVLHFDTSLIYKWDKISMAAIKIKTAMFFTTITVMVTNWHANNIRIYVPWRNGDARYLCITISWCLSMVDRRSFDDYLMINRGSFDDIAMIIRLQFNDNSIIVWWSSDGHAMIVWWSCLFYI